MKQTLYHIDGAESLQTPLGHMEIQTSKGKIVACYFISPNADPAAAPNELTREGIRQLSGYFTGQRQIFDLPLFYEGTDFQQRVFDELMKIPFGSTLSYKQVAGRINLSSSGSRAIGNIIGRNPLLILIPCHRVVGYQGEITGYAGGIERKRWLLQHEMETVIPPGRLF